MKSAFLNKISCFTIADLFISLSNSTGSLITNLKLQKLVFYAQAWHLAVAKEPLFDEDFEAWIHGPVIPELYEFYKDNKWHPIIREGLNESTFTNIKSHLKFETIEILDDVIIEYFGLDAYALEVSTHNENPWLEARNGIAEDEPSHSVIGKESMSKYYSQYVVNG